MATQKEINKLLKKIKTESLKNNHAECVDLHNVVGGLFTEIGSYDEAIHHHKQALTLCKTLGDRLGTAVAFRHIGEAKAALGNFSEAIEDIKRYLELAQNCNDKVEIQRAWTTLGRVYLMQAQELKENSHVIDSRVQETAVEAEKKFQTALNLTDSIRDQVDHKEFAQMNCGLLVNIGLVKDLCGRHTEAVLRFNRAMEICKGAKLKEDLFRCQILLASIYRQKSNIKMAVKESEDALATAKQIGKKILICDAYIERGFVKIYQRDFKNAKKAFAQAYLERSPNEEDHSKAIRLTKLAHLISIAYEELSKNEVASDTRTKLADRLGDLFVAIGAYKLGVEYYRRAFTDAKICGKPKSELARILFSIAETYSDDGQFEHALLCYERELAYRDNNKEQCESLVKIAHMHEYLAHEPTKVCDAYERAYIRASKNPKLMYNVLKYYVPYMRTKGQNVSRYKELDKVLVNLKSYPEVIEEIEKEDQEEANDLEDEIPNIDDIISEDEEDDEIVMVGRRRARGTKKFKANEVGDTPLHEACIKGDLKRVKSLLSQGHEVNPRDNAGWIPLHEACNHGHYAIVECLLENGADVNNRGLKGMTPLHDAATNGHFTIMRLLIRYGANVISLTDGGETVMSCLNDYRQRNYSEMSNNELSEYRQMKAELLNLMDKCGYNLMEVKNKTGSSRSNISSSTESVLLKPRTGSIGINSELESNSVREYRDTIGVLKRKRIPEEHEEDCKKAPLPATYHTVSNPSVSTKEWLIDDVSKAKRTLDRRSLVPDFFDEENDFSDLECEPFPRLVEPEESTQPNELTQSESQSQEPTQLNDLTQSLELTPPHKLTQPHRLAQPLVVHIDDRKLVIPIKDSQATIKWLKNTIVERYSVMVDATPIISLASLEDPTCFFFDADLCYDVIKDDVIANIESWKLSSISKLYSESCQKLHLNELDFVRCELSRLEDNVNKLDLSYVRVPSDHVKPISISLARRNFTTANLTGSSSLFCHQEGKILETLASWKNITNLELRCVGLQRSQFETICNTLKLQALKNLDLSMNSIAYKCKLKFIDSLESLISNCPKLVQVDMRKNHLQFVKLIAPNETSGELNLSEKLDLTCRDVQVSGSDQSNYNIYLAVDSS